MYLQEKPTINSHMNLLQALNVPQPLCAAIVGAGGKTTAAFQLARQADGLAWVTTTTHLGTDQMGYADRHFVLQSAADFNTELYRRQKVTLLTGPFSADNRVHSPSQEVLELMHQTCEREGISLIIEADGSRSIPLKAPGEHEPPIPAWIRQVIVVVGLSALGRPLSDQTVFRAERYSQLTGLRQGDPISIESVCAMLLHPAGGMKNIPEGALRSALFNQADDEQKMAVARSAAEKLIDGGYDRVIIGGLKTGTDSLTCISK